jgi:two-component system nitrogen regulation response regulator NtrX
MSTNDVAHDPRIADHAWAAAHGLVSFAGWPLCFRDERLGVLATFAWRVLGDAELSRLALFAHQAAIAIKNARLFAEVEALSDRLRADNAYLRREAASSDDAVRDLERTPGLAGVASQLRDVAPTPTTVLVHGETGTGKELVARAVHELSARRDRPFVRVNCAALSAALIESELFGHERGAFTGALQRRLGRFELAHGGTLFLDEIGEVPLELQPKLLRVLQEREFERVGGTQTVRVDARIVAATNRDLAREVEAGRFRADLYYRLAVFPIEVPPLRERLGDIPDLVAHLAARLRPRHPPHFTDEALAALTLHSWPGNVRELANIVERLTIICGDEVTGDLVPRVLTRASGYPTAAAPASVAGGFIDNGRSLSERLDDTERELIISAMAAAGSNIAEAARLLKTDRGNLYRRMRRLGIRGGSE